MEWVIGAVVLILIVFIAVILKTVKFKSSEIKGKYGEKRVDRVLQSVAGKNGKVINDYMFKGEQRSVQIDHILINTNGIFVIETKNYAGRIYGNQTQNEWTQVLANGNVKNKFRNPIKQNGGHIYQLKKLLPPQVPLFGLVVFVQDNTQYIAAEGVVGLSGLKNEILRCSLSSKVVLLDNQIEELYQLLIAAKKNEEITNKQHVIEIQEMIEGVSNNKTCPRCGGKLVERVGKYSAFIGCSNYPHCKFTKNL